MHKAFIQVRDEPVLRSISNCAWDGFNLLGYETQWFAKDEFTEGKVKVTPDTVVCGFIWVYLEAIKLAGFTPPKNMDYPEDLKSYLGRKVWDTDLASAKRDITAGKDFFIKPYDAQKGFTGFLTSQTSKLVRLKGSPDDSRVWCSEPIEFVSEYRFFVLHGKVEGVGHYKGDPTVFPNGNVVNDAAEKWKDSPAGYCLDFGVTSEGLTALVEVNDGHSMGDYGLYPVLYARILEARWCELTGKKPIA